MNKTELRKLHKNIRNSISLEEKQIKSEAIQRAFLDLDCVKNADTILVYLSHNNEVLTDKVINECISSKNICIPECNISSETMHCVKLHNNSAFHKNIYGINEIDNPEIYEGDIDIVVVPGIAFDTFGNRIGHGKGYYDKFLNNREICKIAFCYSENLIYSNIPSDVHDIRMDYIITDREVLKIKS